MRAVDTKLVEMQALYDVADREATRRILMAFDGYVDRMKSLSEWLPSDIEDIRRRLEADEIGLIKALWFTVPPEERGDFHSFQDDYLRRKNGHLG